MPPPVMTFFRKTSTKKAAPENKTKSKSKSKSKSRTISFSPETKKRVASFTRKRDRLRGFRRIKHKQQANNCAICLETMLNNGPTTRTPCKHKFHSTCLDTWLIRNNSCPECRQPIQAPIIVPQRTPQMAAIQDANDDANELAILQMVDEYWTQQGRTPVEVELLKLCKLVSLKLARLVRRHSRANTNGLTTAETNARTYAIAHRLDLDYYYSLEDTYHPRLPLEAPAPILPPIPMPTTSPNISLLRTAYTI